MKTKKEIVDDWLPRYTGTPLKTFGDYIILTNFKSYVQTFARRFRTKMLGKQSPMQTATAEKITIINFGMGSPMAATIMDLLTAISPKAVLFLGKCGGLKQKTKIGDLILPIAGIRGEGTGDMYMPPEVPSLPSFRFQRALSDSIKRHNKDYWTGSVYTTNRRVWEHDTNFKKYLKKVRAMAVDMETATIFTVGFMNKIPHGALLLVSDQPMTPEGVKTSKLDSSVTSNYTQEHLLIGLDAVAELRDSGESVKHLRFE